jgi:hypothetical protein
MVFTNVCKKCEDMQCQGGYNCKYGTMKYLKVCKDDFVSGECKNNRISIDVPKFLLKKLSLPDENKHGCINGHHITDHNILPYYEHLKNNKPKKTNLKRTFTFDKYFGNRDYSSDSSSDEEINDMFSKMICSLNEDW